MLFPWSEEGNSQDAFGFMKGALNGKNQYYIVNLPDKIQHAYQEQSHRKWMGKRQESRMSDLVQSQSKIL